MPKTPDKGRSAREHLLRRQFDQRLAAEGLSAQEKRDRRAQADIAASERAERRRQRHLLRRPGYATAEARQPFEPETRIIRAVDPSGDPQTDHRAGKPSRRLTFSEMRAEATAFPDVPAEVRERQRIARKGMRGRRRR
ncbi:MULTISPECIES: hypothetical protein [unclassified Methylobacterium]|uniref:hypothetical protein n=1 Tax=unclassified Methylobacterium TaxID=2615210 RepID=UPI00226AB12D|nr:MULTISPECIES: hypothetical protein [unclassified Methylobacterium]